MPDYHRTDVRFHLLGRTKRAESPADGQHLQAAGEVLTVCGVLLPVGALRVRTLAGVQSRGGWLCCVRLPRAVPAGTEARFTWEGQERRTRVEAAMQPAPSLPHRVVLTDLA